MYDLVHNVGFYDERGGMGGDISSRGWPDSKYYGVLVCFMLMKNDIQSQIYQALQIMRYAPCVMCYAYSQQ